MSTSKICNVSSLENDKTMTLKKICLEAAKMGSSIIIKELLALNLASPNELLYLDFKEGDDKTPLHLACEYGHLEVVKFLLDNGASKNKEMISSALPFSIDYEEYEDLFEILEELLKHGAIVNFTMKNGQSILQDWFVDENKKVLEFLIEKGNFSPKDKETRLHMATKHGLSELVRKCLKEGDDPNLKNCRDQTPYDIAKNEYVWSWGEDKPKFKKIMKTLIGYGAIANEEEVDDNHEDDSNDDEDENWITYKEQSDDYNENYVSDENLLSENEYTDDDDEDGNSDEGYDEIDDNKSGGSIMNISPGLQSIIGVKQATRGEAIKLTWDYIRKNNLQDHEAKAKQGFYPDEIMANVFGKDRIGVLGLATYLSANLYY